MGLKKLFMKKFQLGSAISGEGRGIRPQIQQPVVDPEFDWRGHQPNILANFPRNSMIAKRIGLCDRHPCIPYWKPSPIPLFSPLEFLLRKFFYHFKSTLYDLITVMCGDQKMECGVHFAFWSYN